MAPRTRYFLIGSALVVVVGVCTGLVASYGGALPRAASLSELAYVPGDATAVAFADVRDIMDSQFRRRLPQVLQPGQDKGRLRAEWGIDIEQDIDSVVAGLSGGGPADGGAVVIVRGRFDTARIETLAAEHGAVAAEHMNIRILTAPASRPGAGPSDTMGVAFLKPDLLAFGATETLKRAIDASATHQNIAANDDLMRAVSGIQHSGNAWIVGRTRALTERPDMPDQVRQHLAAVEWIAASADIDQDVRAVVRAEARDEQAGEELRAVVNGALAAARLFAGQDARIGAMLGSLQSSGSGRLVELSFVAPPELLDLIRLAPQGPGSSRP